MSKEEGGGGGGGGGGKKNFNFLFKNITNLQILRALKQIQIAQYHIL